MATRALRPRGVLQGGPFPPAPYEPPSPFLPPVLRWSIASTRLSQEPPALSPAPSPVGLVTPQLHERPVPWVLPPPPGASCHHAASPRPQEARP